MSGRRPPAQNSSPSTQMNRHRPRPQSAPHSPETITQYALDNPSIAMRSVTELDMMSISGSELPELRALEQNSSKHFDRPVSRAPSVAFSLPPDAAEHHWYRPPSALSQMRASYVPKESLQRTRGAGVVPSRCSSAAPSRISYACTDVDTVMSIEQYVVKPRANSRGPTIVSVVTVHEVCSCLFVWMHLIIERLKSNLLVGQAKALFLALR